MADKVALDEVVDLKLFGNFRPELSVEKAIALFGPPIQMAKSENKTIASYNKDIFRIEIEDQLISESGEHAHRRTVYLYPRPKSDVCALRSSVVFHSSIDSLIPQEKIEICAAEPREGQRIWALINNKCVEAINWWAPESQF